MRIFRLINCNKNSIVALADLMFEFSDKNHSNEFMEGKICLFSKINYIKFGKNRI